MAQSTPITQPTTNKKQQTHQVNQKSKTTFFINTKFDLINSVNVEYWGSGKVQER
jgi:hypothetical protein